MGKGSHVTQRAVIYALFSSDLQTDRSIDDQVALCADLTRRQGLTVTASFDARARSGASVFGRDGLLSMMESARAGTFDVLVVEAPDRLSRDQEDLAGIYKRLTHAGIQIRAVHDGRIVWNRVRMVKDPETGRRVSRINPEMEWQSACGRICMHRKKINVSTVLAGQRLGVKEVDDGIWLVSFMHYDLGYIDLEQRTLQTTDNPFGTRLSPMS